jgi:hypothetical protein
MAGKHDVVLTAELTECPLFRRLTPPERAVLTELMLRSRRLGVNGRMAFSEREAADRCNISRETASKAFDALAESGFIVCVKRGSFDEVTGHGRRHKVASEWRLTMFASDVTGDAATRDYLDPLRERRVIAIDRVKGVKFITDDNTEIECRFAA